jgi:serine/threonine protein kinase
MGLVYRARQRRPDRTVAIKVIAPELAADPSFRARFEQESATAAQIEHPNVIPVYEVGDDGQLFIWMRFVQGVDLGRLLSLRGRLDPQRAATIIAQAAAALDAAHAQGLVHRDVKPGNILNTTDDHVYLTDFGLTKRTADSQGMTQAGMYVGTVDYIAPEQVEGKRVDARADVYALGCVTYEVLSGSIPFPRDSDVAKIFAHVNDPPPRLQGVPEPLADAVQRAMAKRPQTPAPPLPPPETPLPTAAAPPPRRRPRALAAGLAALVLLIGAGVAIAVAAGGSGSATTTTTTTATTSSTSTSSTSTPTPQPTAKQIYSPANANGGLAVSNPTTTHGSCFTSSNVIQRADAFRCTSGNFLYDPCFSINDTQLLCPSDGPWANSGVLINVSALVSFGGKDQGTSGQPWAIQMADGTRCLAVSGATNEVAGQRLGYFCKHGVGLYGKSSARPRCGRSSSARRTARRSRSARSRSPGSDGLGRSSARRPVRPDRARPRRRRP